MAKILKRTEDKMSEKHGEGAKRILERVGAERTANEAEQTYRTFVESINRAKEAEMERAMMFR